MASDRSLLGLQHGLRSHETWHNPALCIRATMPSFALLLDSSEKLYGRRMVKRVSLVARSTRGVAGAER
jgi:hypothetical protein